MKEVRTFVGIAREQVNALFGVVAAMEEMLSPKGKTTLPDNNHWYCLQAHVLNGDPCFVLLKYGSICTKLLEIKKAQLQRDGKWVVQLVIEGAQRYSDVSYGSSPKEIGDAWKFKEFPAPREVVSEPSFASLHWTFARKVFK